MVTEPRILYGVHSIAPWRRSDRKPYGLLRVIGSANLGLTSEFDQLYAGSNKFSWAAESKTISSEMTAKVKAYPGFLFELFLGASIVDGGADSAGAVTTLTNYKGTSVQNVTNGVSGVAVDPSNKANLKFGRYVMVALSSGTFDLYISSDIDVQRGVDANVQDDFGKLNTSPIDVSATSQTITNLGLTFTKAGTPAFTVGDTATFEVLPPSTRSSVIAVGQAGLTLPNFGADLYAAKRATGEMFEITAYNCVGAGLPIALEENTFSQPELKMTLLYDAAKNKVFDIRHILPETV